MTALPVIVPQWLHWLLSMNSRSMRTLFLPAALFFVLSLGRSEAYSSPDLRTFSNIRQLDMAIAMYQQDMGKFPNLDNNLDELEDYLDETSRKRFSNDDWGRKIAYLVPGKHGAFDLYSFGSNGVDEQGEGDDISNWAGIREGTYFKKNWPMGRLFLYLALPSALLCLIAGLFIPWRFVVPFAGLVLCAFLFGGCYFFMTPLHTHLNDLLSWSSLGLVLLFLVFIAAFISAFRIRATLQGYD